MEFGYSRNRTLERCKACFAADLVLNQTSATLVCRECGEVQRSSMIVESLEGRSFEEDNDAGQKAQRERVNAMGDTAWDRTEFKGNNEEMALQLNKLSRDVRGRKEKVLEQIEQKTEEIAYALNISASMTENFKDILRKAFDNNSAESLIRKPRPILAASVVYTACRLAHCGRTIEEVCAASVDKVDVKSLRRSQTELCRILGLTPGSVAADEIVARIGSHSKQPPALVEKARQVCKLISKYGLVVSSPPQLVAAISVVLLALVENRKISLRLVAEATRSCSTAQIRRMYTSLYEYIDLLLPIEVRGHFDLHLLPRQLETVPWLSSRSKRSLSPASSHVAQSSLDKPGMPSMTIQAIDDTKPRTRSNSLIEEDWEVIRPLVARPKNKRKRERMPNEEKASTSNPTMKSNVDSMEATVVNPENLAKKIESSKDTIVPDACPKPGTVGGFKDPSPVQSKTAPIPKQPVHPPSRTSSIMASAAISSTEASLGTRTNATASARAYLRAKGGRGVQAALDAVSKNGSPLFLTRR